MKHFIHIFILLLCTTFTAQAQLDVSKTEHHFGNLSKGDQTYVDFYLKNTSDKDIFIIRATAVRFIETRFSNRTIKPDSTVIMRVHYSPIKKGYFTERIQFFHSGSYDKMTFTIDGRVNYQPSGEGTRCPNFDEEDPYERLDFEAQFTVLDTFTKQPIEGAEIKIIRNGKLWGKEYTDANGRAFPKVRIGGPYWFVVSADGYKNKEFDRYMNRANSRLNIHLVPIIETDEPEEPPVVIIEDPNEDIIIEIPVEEPEITEEPEPVTETEEPVTESTSTVNPTELDRDKYKPNNIVFLIDVSSSMNKEGRMELLKAAMIELLEPLRDIDQISIVTYSSGAQVVMSPRPASNKQEIIELIESLEAHGGTQGGKGLRMAYGVAKRHFIRGGNNQIIIATDGAFSDTETNHPGIVKRGARRGIKLSVVGVVNERWTAKSMKAMAKHGKGHYLRIEDYETSKHAILEEIKMNSVRE